jgi:hypothetical protein
VARIDAEEAAERAAELAAAEAAEAEAAAEAAAPAPWSSYSAPAKAPVPVRAPAPAPAVRATGEVARVLEVLKRSPLMLELPANTRGLEAVTRLVSSAVTRALMWILQPGCMELYALHDVELQAMTAVIADKRGTARSLMQADDAIIGATVVLLRAEGLFDAKELLRADASVGGKSWLWACSQSQSSASVFCRSRCEKEGSGKCCRTQALCTEVVSNFAFD